MGHTLACFFLTVSLSHTCKKKNTKAFKIHGGARLRLCDVIGSPAPAEVKVVDMSGGETWSRHRPLSFC